MRTAKQNSTENGKQSASRYFEVLAATKQQFTPITVKSKVSRIRV